MKRPLGFPIIETIKSEECWVCTANFKKVNVEHHHIVPRCYGGEKGPTVSICTDCHTNVHDTADALYAKKFINLNYTDHISRERCLYLATIVVNSRLSLENINNENKRFVYSGFFTGKVHKKLVRLAKYFKMSQQKVIVHGIEQLYKRHFKEEE